MKRLLTALLLAAALLPGAPSPAYAGQVRLDGVTVHLRPGTTQVVTVNHTSGIHARVSYWARQQGIVEKVASIRGFISKVVEHIAMEWQVVYSTDDEPVTHVKI